MKDNKYIVDKVKKMIESGDDISSQTDRHGTKEIYKNNEIIYTIDKSKIIESFYENGKLVYIKDYGPENGPENGPDEWSYDEYRNCIHKIVDGTEYWYNNDGSRVELSNNEYRYYNKYGRIYHSINNENNIETWYNKNSNVRHIKHADGYEVWINRIGRVTHEKSSSNGSIRWFNSKGVISHIKFNDGIEYWYDKNGYIKHIKKSDGTNIYYDKQFNQVFNKFPSGNKVWLNEKNEPSHIKYSDGCEAWYDIDGVVIHSIINGNETFYKNGIPQ